MFLPQCHWSFPSFFVLALPKVSLSSDTSLYVGRRDRNFTFEIPVYVHELHSLFPAHMMFSLSHRHGDAKDGNSGFVHFPSVISTSL